MVRFAIAAAIVILAMPANAQYYQSDMERRLQNDL